MVISDSKDFLFVHVQKAAGSSIRRLLEPYALHPPRTAWNKLRSRLHLQPDYRRFCFGGHAPLRHAEAVMPARRFDEIFKFAFVRNPWDRLVSWYSYVLQHPEHGRHRRIARLGGFEAFVEYEIRRDKISQLEMLSDSTGRLRVDFVGRFETLHEDFEKIRARLDLEGRLVPYNVSRHDAYRSYYTARTRDRVARHWAAEIEAFGYAFDGLRGNAPLPPP